MIRLLSNPRGPEFVFRSSLTSYILLLSRAHNYIEVEEHNVLPERQKQL